MRKEDGGLLDIKLGALSGPDRAWVEERVGAIRRVNSGQDLLLLAQGPAARAGSDGRDRPRRSSRPSSRSRTRSSCAGTATSSTSSRTASPTTG